jgi:hypothetical protein
LTVDAFDPAVILSAAKDLFLTFTVSRSPFPVHAFDLMLSS